MHIFVKNLPTQNMNRLISIKLALVVVLAFVSMTAVAQKDAEQVTPKRTSTLLSDPSPNGFAPVSISNEEAFSEAQANAPEAGFSQAYISESELTKLLSNSKAVGVRFYNAMSDGGSVHLVAVAVSSDGRELNPIFSKSYIKSTNSYSSEFITKTYAKGCVGTLCDKRSLVPFTAFFTKSELSTIMDKPDAQGILLLPGSRKFTMNDGGVKTYKTMIAGDAAIVKGQVSALSNQFKKSLEPCPYHCPDDNYLLSSPRY